MKNVKKILSIIALVFVLFYSLPTYAKGGSSRENHKFGLYVALANDPFPNFWGINAAFNAMSFLRLTAGYGSFSVLTTTMTAFNFGAKGFVPNWSLSPFVGVNYNVVSATGNSFTYNTITIANPATANLNAITLNFGLDWQTQGGFLLGVAYTMPIANTLWAGVGSFGGYIGWIFW